MIGDQVHPAIKLINYSGFFRKIKFLNRLTNRIIIQLKMITANKLALNSTIKIYAIKLA